MVLCMDTYMSVCQHMHQSYLQVVYEIAIALELIWMQNDHVCSTYSVSEYNLKIVQILVTHVYDLSFNHRINHTT